MGLIDSQGFRGRRSLRLDLIRFFWIPENSFK
jgi:hypothetical protein